jgi:UDP-N-acetylmuramoylalanine--D-glutamate ligase
MLCTGGFDARILESADEILLSPGIDPREPAIAAAAARGVPVIGDIELFWRAARAPIVGITGTNAKSTVTTLVGLMAAEALPSAAVGGNLGPPALELLDPAVTLYVLELSSFQLELVQGFCADVAAILNVAPDHLDRYDDMADYVRAKQRIFRGSRVAIFNREDPLTEPGWPCAVRVSFGMDRPGPGHYGLIEGEGGEWLAMGDEPLIAARELALRGRHNVANALAAFAIAEAAGIPRDAVTRVLRSYRGLPHRCQHAGTFRGVDYVDDSKGTNVAAAVAALRGLAPAPPGRIVLIAGGIAKEDDFSLLAAELSACARAALLIGRDAGRIASGIGASVDVQYAGSLEEAVQLAAFIAVPGDVVLLSPACASFDMFRDYAHRGECFARAVAGLQSGVH